MTRKLSRPLWFESLEDRLTPAYAFDPSFGVGGRTFITPGPIPTAGSGADAVVRPDGKIWALGASDGNTLLARFNPDGGLDTTFDGDGVLPIQPWADNVQSFTLSKLALQADGRVVLAGTTFVRRDPTTADASFNFLAMRVNPDGSLDGSFGDGGHAVVPSAVSGYYAATTLLAVGATPDGRVTLAGTESQAVYLPTTPPQTFPGPTALAIRLTATGELDPSYDGDGKATVVAPPGVSGGASTTGAAVLPDGRVLFARSGFSQYDADGYVPREALVGAYRLAADGSPDATFNGTGFAETSVFTLPASDGPTPYLSAPSNTVAVQPDGRVLVGTVVTSYDQGNVQSTTRVVRFTGGGQRDDTFGTAGLAAAPADSGSTLTAFAVLSDGRFVLNVTTSVSDPTGLRTDNDLLGFTADGQPDAAFGPGGTLPTLASPTVGVGLNLSAVVPDGGRIVVVGTTTYDATTTNRIGLVRLANDPPAVPPTANGQNVVGAFTAAYSGPAARLDPSFANGGSVAISSTVGSIPGSFIAAATAPDGGYVLLARLHAEIVVARFTAHGRLDPSFDGDGVRILGTAADPYLLGESLLVQPDGRIVVVIGDPVVSPAGGRVGFQVIVRRLNADGTDDATFGPPGGVTPDADPASVSEDDFRFTRLADGRLQILSSDYAAAAPSQARLIVRRLTADGRPDATFGTNGVLRVTVDPGKIDQLGQYQSFPDGSVAVGGTRTNTSDQSAVPVYAVVLRLTPAGVPDPAFGTGGYAETLLETVTTTGGGSNAATPTPPLLAVQPDGGIVVGTRLSVSALIPGNIDSFPPVRTQFDIVRFTPGGSPDAAFGTAGRLVLDARSNTTSSNTVSYFSLAALSDGGLSLLSSVYGYAPYIDDTVRPAGTAATLIAPSVISTSVRRFTADGRADARFGVLGTVTFSGQTPGGLAIAPYTQIVDAENRVVLGGTADRGVGLERVAATASLFATRQPTVCVSGGAGLVEGFQEAADGTLVSAGTYAPFDGYTGPVRVATGDLNGDGIADTIFSTGDRGSQVRLLLGLDPDVAPTALVVPLDITVFESAFDGGVSVAAGDVDGDGRAEFAVTPNVGGSGRVVVYSLADGQLVVRANFFGIDDQAFRGGATAAFGDIDADGKADLIVAAGVGGGPRVAVFTGRTLFDPGVTPPKLVNDFFAFPGPDAENLRNGVAVAAGDTTGDGVADLIFGGGPGGAPRVYALDGATFAAGRTVPVANFFVGGDTTTRNGVRLAIKDLDGDGRQELVANATGSTSRAYGGTTLVQSNGTEPPAYDDFDSLTAAGESYVYVG